MSITQLSFKVSCYSIADMKSRHILIATLCTLLCFSGTTIANPEPSVEFGFAVNDKVAKDPRVVSEGQDGCGAIAYAKIRKMPSLNNKGYLIPDLVIEVDNLRIVVMHTHGNM
jgi:hypothetical protein